MPSPDAVPAAPQTLERYLQTTHGKTHTGYELKLLDAFSITKHSETDRFVDHGNRMLLWHGSRLTNWAGIFGAGLKIAPPEAPCTGYMVRTSEDRRRRVPGRHVAGAGSVASCRCYGLAVSLARRGDDMTCCWMILTA